MQEVVSFTQEELENYPTTTFMFGHNLNVESVDVWVDDVLTISNVSTLAFVTIFNYANITRMYYYNEFTEKTTLVQFPAGVKFELVSTSYF